MMGPPCRAAQIGLAAASSKQALGFSNQNLVMNTATTRPSRMA
jgi:hypothetical protein